jgi:FKBP-type peptidyl-prolyl cis-trans isomerase
MQKIRLPLFGLLMASGLAFSVQAGELATMEQRFSYALGFQFAQQLKSQGVKVDGASFAAAIDDTLQGKEPRLTLEQMQQAMQEGRAALIKAKREEAQRAAEAGKTFLAENKAKAGVVELPNGLQYIEMKKGSGDSPATDATVTVNYRGTFINGEEFDSSYRRGKPTTFNLGGVIPGFREAISRMQPGAKWKVFIPSELGYGPSGAGSSIGPNETLIFEIELISFEAAEAKKEK